MVCKTLLTHMSRPEQVDRLLDVAIPLAREHGSHLIGLHVTPQTHIYVALAGEMSAAVYSAQSEYDREQADRIKRRFEKRTKNEDLVCEWRHVSANGYPVADAINANAAAADLVITSQSTEGGDWETRADLPIRIIMQSGRPVLIVPNEGTFERIGRYVTVAWDGGREAARAAFDALPILQRAETVKVLSLDQDSMRERTSFTPGDAITLSLARDGVAAEAVHASSGNASVGEVLLAHAAESGSDLLVMGCYGHARFKEFVFGGATKHVLDHTSIPVLMSH